MISLAPRLRRETHTLWVRILVVLISLYSFNSFAQNGSPCYKPLIGPGTTASPVGGSLVDVGFSDPNHSPDNLTDGNTDNYAEIDDLLALGTNKGVSVADAINTFPAGWYAGYVVQLGDAGILDANVLINIQVQTYNDGVFAESKTFDSGLGVTLLSNGSPDKFYLSFKTTKPFDEVRLVKVGALNVSTTSLKIYYATAFDPACGTLDDNQICYDQIAGNQTIVNFNAGLLGALATLDNPSNITDGDKNTAATLELLIGTNAAATAPFVGVKSLQTIYPAGNKVGFIVQQNNGLLTADVLSSLRIVTLLHGEVQDNIGLNTGTGLVSANVLAGTDPIQELSITTTKPFNEVRLVSVGIVASIATLDIFYAFEHPVTCTDCKTALTTTAAQPYTGELVVRDRDPSFLGVYNTTGVYGLTAGTLTNTSALVTPSLTDSARFNVLAGLLDGGARMTVKRTGGANYPVGTVAGFAVRSGNGILSAGLLSGITIRLYEGNGQNPVQTISGASLLNLGLLSSSGLTFVGGKSTVEFDEIEIDIDLGLLSVGLPLTFNVYYAYVQIDTDGDGVPDCNEICGPGGDDSIDTDGDGTPDACDDCDALNNKSASIDTDGDLIFNNCDIDSDNDGIPDAIEDTNGNLDPNDDDQDGDGIPNYLDLDSDNDGILDLYESGLTPAQISANDPDGNGVLNGQNPVAVTTPRDTDGDGVPDYLDLDSDNDGIKDLTESGRTGLTDANNDGVVDGPDTDNDGVQNSADGAPTLFGSPGTGTIRNTDGDNSPDYRDLDSDNDGIKDLTESGRPNLGTLDANNDGVLDGADADGDGIRDNVDTDDAIFGSPEVITFTDTDSDTVPNYIDLDSDNDGIKDLYESGLLNPGTLDPDGNGVINAVTDADNDGIEDAADGSTGTFGSVNAGTPRDSDGDTVPDYRDLDSDNDGIKDLYESGLTGFTDANNDGVIDTGADTDKDGVQTSVDSNDNTFGSVNAGTPRDSDGDTVPDFQDLDSDNDGIKDLYESGIANPGTLDPDGNGVINTGTDADNDGIQASVDSNDGLFGSTDNPTARDTDSDTVPDYRDLDSDNDGVKDLYESGVPNPGTLDGDGNGVIDSGTDADRDGIQDSIDNATGTFGSTDNPTLRDTDSDTVPNYRDLDSDNDGIKDLYESGLPNLGTIDSDGNGVIDTGADTDKDGVQTSVDSNDNLFGSTDLAAPLDTDGDNVPDVNDLDSDNDSINDIIENGDPNITDGNNNGMVEGPDLDGDGILGTADTNDGQFGSINNILTPANSDNDPLPNFQDLDSDNDSVSDLVESGDPNATDTPENGVVDGPDNDGDGIQDSVDGAPNTFGDANSPAPQNTDGTDTPDYIDTDSNNDGTKDIVDNGNGGLDTGGDGMIDNTTDPDNDGIADVVDEQLGMFGGLSQAAGTPDLTPSVFSNGGTYNVSEQKDIVIVIYNTGDGATSGPVTFELNKLTPSFTIAIDPNATTTNVTAPAATMPPTVNNSEWTFTEQATRYVVTLKDGFSIPAGANKKIVIQVTATNTPNAAATITARVFNGTGGGETPTTNNSAVYRISINDSNN